MRQPQIPEQALRLLSRGTEFVTILFLLAEVVILGLGVTARYLLNAPLFWVDEVASLLFIWLAMLGSVVALQRGEHMRLTAIVSRCSNKTAQRLEFFSSAVVLCFVGVVLLPSFDYFDAQSMLRSPALALSDGIRVSAISIGLSLMGLSEMLRCIARGTVKETLAALAVIGAIALIFWLCKPALEAMGRLNLLVFFIGTLGACVLMGVPIAFSFAISTFGFLFFTTNMPIEVIVSRMDEGMSNSLLLAIPMFILLGLLVELAGLARALIDFMLALIGRVRGGLAYVLISAMYLVSGISGSKAADMAAVAPGLIPEMRRRGGDPNELAALLAASGAQTETIPPSLVLIMVGSATGVSIAALFVGGLLPAFVCGIALAIVSYFKSSAEIRAPHEEERSNTFHLFALAIPALLLPFIIRSAVVEGIATATEVSTIGVLYTLIVGPIVYRKLDGKKIYPMLVNTVALTGSILLILGAAAAMAWALTQAGFAKEIVHWMSHIPGGKNGFLLISILVFVVLGSVLEGLPAILVFGPMLFPVAKLLGVHEVHYAMVVIISMGIGLFSPPFGVGYYAACAIAGVSPDATARRIVPYMLALVLALLLITFIPWLSTGFL
jgi:tripartite ATP-independent transporter DctM subunit